MATNMKRQDAHVPTHWLQYAHVDQLYMFLTYLNIFMTDGATP